MTDPRGPNTKLSQDDEDTIVELWDWDEPYFQGKEEGTYQDPITADERPDDSDEELDSFPFDPNWEDGFAFDISTGVPAVPVERERWWYRKGIRYPTQKGEKRGHKPLFWFHSPSREKPAATPRREREIFRPYKRLERDGDYCVHHIYGAFGKGAFQGWGFDEEAHEGGED